MEVYCVKEKRHTPNVKASEKVVITKNNRKLLKVKCASCGITTGFQLEFRNRFQALEEESVEPELSSFHQKVRVAGEKILRLKKRK